MTICTEAYYEYAKPDSYPVEVSTLNHLLKCEIILDVLMREGIHNWEGFDKAMQAAFKEVK